MEERYALELIEKGKRIDERKFDEFRAIDIKTGLIQTAEGSASVALGDTKVIAGIKLGIGEPFPDTPNEGILMVNTEFTPLASPDFESGPPGEDAVELSRIVDRGLRESNAIELDKLCIIPKEKVWMIFVDIHIINHHGNLLDASALAALSALLNTKIPKIEDDAIVRKEFEKDLPVVLKPITITVGKVGNNFIIDPNLEEEKILESKMSICVRDDDKICAIQKQGRKEIDFEDLEKIFDIVIEKSKEIRKLIK